MPIPAPGNRKGTGLIYKQANELGTQHLAECHAYSLVAD
jgi:hypothetical protein